MANFTALAVARRAMTPGNVREDGLAGPDRPRLTVYASDQVHSCVDKAVDLLGIGTRQLRKLESGPDFRIPLDALEDAIAADRKAGFLPAIVVGNAGTVNTGTIDPLDHLADLCAREKLWFHVDGAYGALASIVPELAPLFAGMDRADSMAADPHKWLYVPYEAGATLVREPGRFAATFRKFPEYLAQDPESIFPGPAWFAERGVELSRGFKALKVWMGLKVHGRRAYAERIASDVRLAKFLAAEVDRRPDFERLAETVLSIVNFRYRPTERAISDAELDRAQPEDHQPPRRRRRVLPRADGLEGPLHSARRDHELPDARVGPHGPPRRGRADRPGASRGGLTDARRLGERPSSLSSLRTLVTLADLPLREPSPPERGRGQGEGVGPSGQVKIAVGRSTIGRPSPRPIPPAFGRRCLMPGACLRWTAPAGRGGKTAPARLSPRTTY